MNQSESVKGLWVSKNNKTYIVFHSTIIPELKEKKEGVILYCLDDGSFISISYDSMIKAFKRVKNIKHEDFSELDKLILNKKK